MSPHNWCEFNGIAFTAEDDQSARNEAAEGLAQCAPNVAAERRSQHSDMRHKPLFYILLQ
jgi:hypothetical protein